MLIIVSERTKGLVSRFFCIELKKLLNNKFSAHISVNIIYHQESKRNSVTVQCEINKIAFIT